ncbi:MAG TPA: polysulfide reductase NrfD [Bacteroidia bacterium]|nr:polysulfide reductase NrfD [Sphingobacteriales bacterium]HPD64501.1 polysulfide reductase NrfD [Bacteroidia bacterium]HRS58257.1 polysulfide reductase NrfD [Bacteroidia bacterium]HRU67689.1 polysulfide reductase NrfD [Bacteroidia bacterium]
MREEIIISGRMNPNIDPVLHIWHWQIPTYLFLGGLAAGLMFFAALFTIQKKDKLYPTAVKWGSFLVPFAIIIGLLMLFLDLKHKLFFWQLYTTVRWESPMSWGAWTLLFVTFISIIWCLTYLNELMDLWKGKKKWLDKWIERTEKLIDNNKWLKNFIAWSTQNRIAFAWAMIVLGVILGIYTGILLSAFNARPLWNTSILGPLFMVSGFSTAAAAIMWMSKNHEEKVAFGKIDLLLIAIELFFIVHLFMGFLASTEVQIEAAKMFLGGEYTTVFWVFVVGAGLVIPAFLEILKLSGFKVPVFIPSFLILLGGIIFRFIMVEAGQVTRYLY